MFNTPVLFIVFNRPDTTQQVFDVIRLVKPKYLFIAADGPREKNTDDIERCNKTRSIISKVDWDCDVKTLLRENNLGCGIAVSTAVSWFFEQIEEGIILEDDCLPHLEFFNFCEDLLLKYRHNPLILSIAGSNFQTRKRGRASYYYSIHNRIWGWATWRRTWKSYDYYLNNIDDKEFDFLISRLFRENDERKYWLGIFNLTKAGAIDTWDYQFMFLQWKLGGFTLTPNTNLISNIGFGDDATHTAWGKDEPNLNRPIGAIYPLVHADKIKRNQRADEYYFFNFLGPKSTIFFKIKQTLKKIPVLRSIGKKIYLKLKGPFFQNI